MPNYATCYKCTLRKWRQFRHALNFFKFWDLTLSFVQWLKLNLVAYYVSALINLSYILQNLCTGLYESFRILTNPCNNLQLPNNFCKLISGYQVSRRKRQSNLRLYRGFTRFGCESQWSGLRALNLTPLALVFSSSQVPFPG